MKRRILTLLAALALLVSLTACGRDQTAAPNGAADNSVTDPVDGTQNGTGSVDGTQGGAADSAPRDVDGDGYLEYNAGSGSGAAPQSVWDDRPGNAVGNAVHGAENALNGAGNALKNTARRAESAVTGDRSGYTDTPVRAATYPQMLRNGQTHDTNGNLWDMENTATPGTMY